MLAIILKNSFFISLLRKTAEVISSIEQWLDKVYYDSQTYKIIARFWNGARINFKYSFLGKISEIFGERNIIILDNSMLAKWLLNLYNMWKLKIAGYTKTSRAMSQLVSVKRDIYFSPVKTGSIVVVAAILINIIFSVLLSEKIILIGWIIRLIFLFIGLRGLSCNANWEEVKKTSFVLKKGLI